MMNIFKLAARNLLRYKRRTLLTVLLIVLGVTLVILFSGLSGSFKSMMVGIITDSNLGHLQVHRKGYVASIDALPLNLNMKPAEYGQVRAKLETAPQVAGFAPRIKIGAMLSNFVETTSVRITAIDPDRELVVSPALPGRIRSAAWKQKRHLLGPGEILVPLKIANALNVKEGDSIVLVATNREGSVNGLTFTVVGLVEDVAGPQGKDGFIHIDDARTLLRIEGEEVSEVAVRVKDFSRLEKARKALEAGILPLKGGGGDQVFELHSWAELTPFANIAKMIDLLTVTMKIIMVGIVLISVLNVMLMSVYERVREIGTIAAIGTTPSRILSLFLVEGLLLGLVGAALGIALGVGGVGVLNLYKVRFRFSQMDLVLAPTIQLPEVLAVAATVLVIALLATLQPAWKASRMEPVDALRHV